MIAYPLELTIYDALDQLRGIISETSGDPAWRGQIKKDM